MRMKRRILGAHYELSVAFLPPRTMRRLNATYRDRAESTDVLAFPLTPGMGELLFSSADTRRRAPLFGMGARAYLGYLFIHGCLHLKGYDHGRTMERLEDSWCRAFRIPKPAR